VIQAARDEEGRLRAAWQVLSDPVQRQRYDDLAGLVPSADGDHHDLAPDHDHDDDQDHDQDHDDDEGEDDSVDSAVPATRDRSRRNPPSMITAEGLEIPSAGRRATAAGIDTITLLVLYVVIVYPIIFGLGLTGIPAVIAGIGTPVFLIVVYLIIPTYRGGQTLGKRYTYTMVVDRATGQLPTLSQVVRRYTIPAFAVVLLQQTGGLIALMYAVSFLMNRDQVSLADRMAKTAVIIARYRPDRLA
ncbi:MAG TPA: RDD family protein, partial [Acidimicrobiia bacterium]